MWPIETNLANGKAQTAKMLIYLQSQNIVPPPVMDSHSYGYTITLHVISFKRPTRIAFPKKCSGNNGYRPGDTSTATKYCEILKQLAPADTLSCSS